MNSVANMTEEQALREAKKIVSGLDKPDDVDRVSVEVGPDHQGETSLWFKIMLKPHASDTREAVQILGNFSHKLVDKVFERGIKLFPYTVLEAPETRS